MLRVGHLSCLELGTFASSAYELGTSHAFEYGYELGTFDASSWAPLMLRAWAPLMLRVGHL